MSEEGSFGLSFAERFFGLVVLVAGLLTTYYTVTSIAVLGAYTPFFVFLCIIVLIIGIVLLSAKTEE